LYGRNGIAKFGNFMQRWVKGLPNPVEPEVIEPEVIEPEVIEPEVVEPVEPEVVEPEVTELQDGGLEKIEYTEVGGAKHYTLSFYHVLLSPEDILELAIIQKGRITRKRYKTLGNAERFSLTFSRKKSSLIEISEDDLGKTISQLGL